MHATDRESAIALLRSIALVAIDCAEQLEGSRPCPSTLDESLAEASSLIELDNERIQNLAIWEES